MSLERRLQEHFGAADLLAPEGDVATVIRRGRRRRLLQTSAVGFAGVAVILAGGLMVRDLVATQVTFVPGAGPSEAVSPPVVATQRPSVAVADLGAPVLAYGSRDRELVVVNGEQQSSLEEGRVPIALPDGHGGAIAQTGTEIRWFPQDGPVVTLAEADETLELRTLLPGGRVLYSTTDKQRSEDMLITYFTVALQQGAQPEVFATDGAFESWSVGPAVVADGRLVIASCHMLCSVHEWPEGYGSKTVYHGGGGNQGTTAGIEGLTATSDGSIVGMVEFATVPGAMQPELVLVDSDTWERRAVIPLPLGKRRPVGRAVVSLSDDGQRVLVAAGTSPTGSVPQQTFLVEDALTPAPRLRPVDYDGVVRWLDPAAANRSR